MSAVGVAIVGASGYGSRELIRILLGHPGAKITLATSRRTRRRGSMRFIPASRAGSISPASRSTPMRSPSAPRWRSWACLTPPAWRSSPRFAQRGVRVIDLSADYRLTDPQVYADWYNHAHTDPEGLRQAVYGLPELYREQIPPAGLIANPGCYTSTSILALAPLVAEDRIDRTTIIIDAKSGVSGAGPLTHAGDPLPRVQREPLGLQRRQAPAHARDRPGPDRRRPPQSQGAAGRSR